VLPPQAGDKGDEVSPLREHDRVRLLRDLPLIRAGAEGAIVSVHAGGAAYTVEFMFDPEEFQGGPIILVLLASEVEGINTTGGGK
jgi:hypothetical protein